MTIKPPSPNEWHIFRRLTVAGCPLDLERLEPPTRPLRILQVPWTPGHAVMPDATGTGLITAMRIIAAERITICRLRLELPTIGEAAEVAPCPEHANHYCLLWDGKHVPVPAHKVLSPTFSCPIRLRPGESVAGAVMWLLQQAPSLHRDLDATLWVEDILGRNYPYAVTFRYKPISELV